MNTRQRWLALALIATVAAALWPEREDSNEVVESVQRADKTGQAAAPAVDADVLQATAEKRERIGAMQANLFPVQTWVPPPPPPPKLKPEPPKPPPLPFKYLGRWVEGGKQTLFLVQGEQPIPISQGQVLSGSWRVDEITEGSVVFTYLPLNMQSILGITP